jgi:exodeoxyribonuclease VII large subunit
MTDQPLFQILFEEAEERRPLTVSELNAEVRSAVEKRFSSVWVEGEVVGFMQASSGHWYFNLNDGDSQIKCVCWKGTNYRVRFRPQNGITVRIRGKLTFWETKGELKLVVDSLEPSGEGALRAAFEQIKAKLEADGLFADELKRPIPFFPRRVAVVTSRTGAAYHDIHTVLTRRARSVSILLIPALVQGEGSADSIRQAITDVNAFNSGLPGTHRIDVMIVGRGGGSAEDLWAFNDEMLARAIRASEIPIISAVGHEIDWTIADLVCDLRAATPSAAAEIVAGREEDILATLRSGEGRMISILEYRMLEALTNTGSAVSQLNTAFAGRLQAARSRFQDVAAGLSPVKIASRVAAAGSSLDLLDQRCTSAMTAGLKLRDEKVRVQMAKLDALSPLAVLTRGYSITQSEEGSVIRDAASAKPGDKLKIRLERGKLNAEVLSSEP